MAAEHRSTRKRAYPDENTDTSAVSPRKRRATGSSRSTTTASTDIGSGNTLGPCIVQSPYFSPPGKARDTARKKRLLAASQSLLEENNRFVKHPSGTSSPAEPVETKRRDRQNVTEASAAITEHLLSALSESKSRKRKTRKDPGSVVHEETGELSAGKANLTALEKQVRVRTVLARLFPQTNPNRYQA